MTHSSRRLQRLLGVLAALGVCLGLCVGCSTTAPDAPAPATDSPSTAPSDDVLPTDEAPGSTGDAAIASAEPQPSAADAQAALQTLASLPVKGRAPKTGYARSEFGKGWRDPDRNGCDARNDVLARDLVAVQLRGPCTVLSGTLHDPYTGGTIAFVRGDKTSQAVQIDHVVALSDAWQKGAQQLSADQRLELANDPRNLLAVDGPTNTRKGDGDAATWLPPNRSFRCSYVSRQIVVKSAYSLWVTQAEAEAMRHVLSSC
ncbi:HNH endonuclease family protein [Pseudoclavibacter sp. CFCC 13611]|uniref:HNH endonuclease family protein n=1 Tax=Pseudoclavibacter sp. CFCC 13611 TaxID=2615178 RepID=UPI001300DA9A|nr:HNH endonuclease family protein [Pseudoclavibacter sp. CFCC 13611]KAB1663744.1 DUF1524 domain-containing protein [Pseudoclavibacter sp. CFCC 13611]KAB1664507.1 DUF1524 domain-containing protein [Pseudoclavibacter sp. CFCC 13611]